MFTFQKVPVRMERMVTDLKKMQRKKPEMLLITHKKKLVASLEYEDTQFSKLEVLMFF